ncbi:MAG: 2,3-bisphosphoglycerate-independent phosphoglycerate mutase [Alphaproteobacteria bacterium]
MKPKGSVVLCILDGWGWREEKTANAVALASTPAFDDLWQHYPRSFLTACGADVGLPDGQIGNSEVGHMNLGAGRVVYQDLPKITKAFAANEHQDSPVLLKLVQALKKSGGSCHLMGLISDGGVHSHHDHFLVLAEFLTSQDIHVILHLWTDGRDVMPNTAKAHLGFVLDKLQHNKKIEIGSVSGRYFSMDRDNRWERVEQAWRVMVKAEGATISDVLRHVQAQYDKDVFDEFIPPAVMAGYQGMKDGDAVLCINFRSDRVREIMQALLDPQFQGFERGAMPTLVAAVSMTEYSSRLTELMDALFPPKNLTHVLGEVVANAGLTQLRIAETEKYPHVTFFLNGGREQPYEGEQRIMVPSPKVATYDLQPEMSAPEVTAKVVEAVNSGQYDLIVINYANPDMVGHTGSLSAAIKAVEAVDQGLGLLAAAVRNNQGVLLVTADHGNCEMMADPQTGEAHTAHTLNKVPLVFAFGEHAGRKNIKLLEGRLADIAPTLLDLLAIKIPSEMSGKILLV